MNELVIKQLREEDSPLIKEIYDYLKSQKKGYFHKNYVIIESEEVIKASFKTINVPREINGIPMQMLLNNTYIEKYPLTMICLNSGSKVHKQKSGANTE